MMKPSSSYSYQHNDDFSNHTRLDCIGAIGTSFNVLFGNLCAFLTISLLYVPFVVGVVILLLSDESFQQTTTQQYGNSQFGSSTTNQLSLESGTIVGLVVLSLLFAPVIYLATAATIRATAEIRAGATSPKLVNVLRVGVRNICRLFCFGLVLMIPVLVLLVTGALVMGLVVALTTMSSDDGIQTFGIVLAVLLIPIWLAAYMFVMIPFQVAPPSLVLEQRLTVVDVVSRAWELSNGRRCDIFCAFFLLGLINAVAGMIPFLNLFWNLCAIPMNSILATVLFLNLRVEKEGFTQSALRDELGMGMDQDLDLGDETELTMGKPGIV